MWLHRFCRLQMHGRRPLRPARQSRRTWRLLVAFNSAQVAVPDAAATHDSPSNRRIAKEGSPECWWGCSCPCGFQTGCGEHESAPHIISWCRRREQPAPDRCDQPHFMSIQMPQKALTCLSAVLRAISIQRAVQIGRRDYCDVFPYDMAYPGQKLGEPTFMVNP